MGEDDQRREDDRTIGRNRMDERGDAAEPYAPTAAEQNEGMSTILSADTVDGVQSDAGDE